MTVQKALLFAISAVLAGCVTAPERPAQVRVTVEEVTAYVRTHWTDYERRVGLRPRNGERAVLVAIGDPECEDYFGTALCQVPVTVRFGDETTADRLWSTFDRKADGSLEEVIILVHERIRR